jgi:hypothetical protein
MLKHDPEKWVPVSRLREAMMAASRWFDASAGGRRSDKIMLKQKAKAKYPFSPRSFRFSVKTPKREAAERGDGPY